MKYFPVFLDLDDRSVVLVGSGAGLDAKLLGLARTGARLTLYSNTPSPRATALAAGKRVTLQEGLPDDATLAAAALVYLAPVDVRTARALRARCAALGTLVNSVDDAAASDFISAAIVDRDPVVVAIGSEGAAPVLVRWIKSRIEALLDADTGAIARLAAQLRPAVRSRLSPAARLSFWREFFGGRARARLRRLGAIHARRSFHAELTAPPADADIAPPRYPIALVGAGPGDPDLLTLRARALIEQADVVLYDRLADPRIVDLARREATLVEVGKQAGAPGWRQDDINRAIVEHARAGRRVVRLKSGDPLIFGRADEELDAITNAGLDYDIVPGITAAAAAAAALGTSLTRRERNSSLRFVTARDVRGYAEHDWRALAAPGATAAVYMGVGAARFLQGRLLLHGAAPSTPVSVVENASRPQQHIVDTTLADFAGAIEQHDINGPAVIFIGLAARASRDRRDSSSATLQLAAV